MEKDWPRRPFNHQLQKAKKKKKKESDRAITPAAEAVRVPANQAAAPPSRSTHWSRAATNKIILVSMCAGSYW